MWDPEDQWKKCIDYSGKLTAVTNANSHLAKWTRPEITILGVLSRKREYLSTSKEIRFSR